VKVIERSRGAVLVDGQIGAQALDDLELGEAAGASSDGEVGDPHPAPAELEEQAKLGLCCRAFVAHQTRAYHRDCWL